MSVVSSGVVVLACALVSAWLCDYLRGWLDRRNILDHPGARSLHARPVPRGGGLAIAAVVLTAGTLACLLYPSARPGGLVVLAAALGYALLGWCDDRQSRPALTRLLVQLVLAAAVVWLLPAAVPGWPLALLVTVTLVWHVNLFNFMDGADGLAATQTVCTALAIGTALGLAGDPGFACVAFALAGAALGFMRFNWAPASLFLGDSGSYFIGFLIAALILRGASGGAGAAPLLILPAPFVVDATLTLVGRMVAGERWWQAHRTHVFQRLVLGGWKPARLATALALLNVLLCWPLAGLAARLGYGATAAAYLVLGVLWLWLRLGSAGSRGQGPRVSQENC